MPTYPHGCFRDNVFGDRKTLSSASKVDYRKIKLTLDVNLRQLNYDRLHSYLVLPRIGGRGELLPADGAEGDSALVHSVYMQIQVPFFRTFRHYNPAARLLFFTNLKREGLPRFLLELFDELSVETVTLPYTRRPPKGWYEAWQNQFYLYDILSGMDGRMQADDTLLVCDADCLCRMPLDPLFDEIRNNGVHSMSLSPTVPLLLTASPCRRWKRSTKPATANLPVCHLLTTEGNSSG